MKKARFCTECGKPFKPMSDKQWARNRQVHVLTSKRHERTIVYNEAKTYGNPIPNASS
jgi:hypothetical protein